MTGADGTSPATELLARKPTWVRAWNFAEQGTLLAPWTVRNSAASTQDERGGLALFGNVMQRTHAARVELDWNEPLDASSVDALEFELGDADGSVAKLAWVSSEVAPCRPADTSTMSVAMRLPLFNTTRVFPFPLSR